MSGEHPPPAGLTKAEVSLVVSSAAGGLISVESEGRIRWANAAAEELLDSDEPLTGAMLADVLPEVDLDHQPRDGSSWGFLIERSFDRGIRTLDVSVHGAPDLWLVRVAAATDHSLEERLGMLTKRQLLAATEQSPIGLAVLGLDGTYLRANDAFCRLAGIEPDTIHRRSCHAFSHPDDVADDLKMLTDLATGRIFSCVRRKRFMRPDGSQVWVQMHAGAVIDDHGGIACITTQAVDITAQMEAERARLLAEESARKALANLSFRSSHDMLTGLLNRRALLSSMDRLLREARGSGQAVAVAFCDLDNLKEINDGVSHEAGDAILIQLADSLKRSLRAEDLVGRVGGDEFVVVLRDVHGSDEAATIAETIRQRASTGLAALVGLRVPSGVSMGLRMDDGTSSAAQLLRDADAALHEAKGSGRNQIVVFDEELQQRLDRVRQLRIDLNDAIEAGDVHAWFQPIVDLQAGAVVGYEALARWVSPDGVRDAGDWIAAIAETPLISRVGDIVLAESVAWLTKLPEPTWIAVNVSAREISTPGFVEGLTRALREAGVPPHRFIVEVTESVVMDRTTVRRQLDAMVAAGLRLHFDDFGTGYASLNHLHLLPVSGVKLDRGFTAALSDDAADAADAADAHALVRGIAVLADSLGLSGVAEGIETQAQAETLRSAGWRYGQGYLFGRAAAAIAIS